MRFPSVMITIAALGACGGIVSTREGDASTQAPAPYSGPSSDAPAIASLEDYCSQRAAFACELVARCCGATVPDCASGTARCVDATRRTAPPGSTFDPIAAGVCLAAMRRTYSTCEVLAVTSDPSIIACGGVFNRRGAPGAACWQVEECAYVRHTFTDCAGAAGGCVNIPLAGVGQPCAEPGGPRCDVDLSCRTSEGTDPRDAGGTSCVPLAPVGAPCSFDVDCAVHLRCEPTSRRCTARFADGARCGSPQDCVSLNCQHGFCAPPVTVCESSELTGFALGLAR